MKGDKLKAKRKTDSAKALFTIRKRKEKRKGVGEFGGRFRMRNNI
jgi:thiamine pyrophosphokinase